jgi:hypothetical protein
MTARNAIRWTLVALPASLALFFWLRSMRTNAETDGNADGGPSDLQPGSTPWTGLSAPERQGTVAEPSAPVLDRKRADEMREKIRALLAEAGPAWGDPERVAAGAHTDYPEMPAPPASGGLPQSEQGKYIRQVVQQQFLPLGRQCYQNLLSKNPGAAGTFEVDFRIVGDRKIGGVVDQANVGDASDMAEPDFVKCMTESMMSVTFDAPPGGGQVTVNYPFVFTPD